MKVNVTIEAAPALRTVNEHPQIVVQAMTSVDEPTGALELATRLVELMPLDAQSRIRAIVLELEYEA